MSSRQTGSRYMNNGSSRMGYEHGVNQAGIQQPGLLSTVFGKDKLTGGLTTGADGKLSFTPVQGSSGIFGGQSRINAALLNAQLGGQVLGQQHEKEMLERQKQADMEFAQLQNTLTEHLNKSTQINAIATKLGIPVDQLTEALGKELASNALQDTKNTGAALQNPDVQKSYATGLIAGNEAQGAKNASLRSMSVPSGGVGIMPGLTGQASPTIGYGATPRQTSSPNMMNFNGQPVQVGTKTMQDYAPARVAIPDLFKAAQSVQPEDQQNPDNVPVNALQQYLMGGMTTGSAGGASPALLGLGGALPQTNNIDPSSLTNPDATNPDKANSGGSILDMLKGLTTNGDASQSDLINFYQRLMTQGIGQGGM